MANKPLNLYKVIMNCLDFCIKDLIKKNVINLLFNILTYTVLYKIQGICTEYSIDICH